jgi:hypothetical protein
VNNPWKSYLIWCDHDIATVCADHLAEWPMETLRFFEEQGLLRPAQPLTEIDCPNCPDEPSCDVVWGPKYPVLRCPRCGPSRVDPARLRNWVIDPNGLAQAVALRLGMRGDVEMLSPQHLWRLGKTYWSGRPTTVFLGRQLGGTRDATFLASFEQSTSAVLLVVGREPSIAVRNPVTPLSLILRWEGNDFSVDAEFAKVQARPAPAKVTTRSVTRMASRMAFADRLRSELESHLRSLAEHFRFARESGLEAVPLPCPTQRELAERIGTNPATVTRIFSGDRELRRLLDLAQDPLAILSFQEE